jgi:hypothetical protein
MNVFLESQPLQLWDKNSDLFPNQIENSSVSTQHFPYAANLCGCISPENYSQ